MGEQVSNELEGATLLPEMNAYPADAGEFAALWNGKTDDGREEFLDRLIGNSQTAVRCIVEDHETVRRLHEVATERTVRLSGIVRDAQGLVEQTIYANEDSSDRVTWTNAEVLELLGDILERLSGGQA